jgi:DNA-directed RNA polymerase subunit beta
LKEKTFIEKLDKDFEKKTADMKSLLIDKMMSILSGKVTTGIQTIYKEELISKGTKFTSRVLADLDFSVTDGNNWTKDEDTNKLVKIMLHNYNMRANEELGKYKREKFNISIGDELPAGVLNWLRFTLLRNVS